MIYLDHAASTPIAPEVKQAMLHCLEDEQSCGNPSSVHAWGLQARSMIEQSRITCARCVGAAKDTLIFTSGATESVNLAIQGVARFHSVKGRHIITTRAEHKAVLETCRFLENEQYRVSYLPVDPAGQIDLDQLRAHITSETILVSVTHVNSETGVIAPIEAIAAIAQEKGVFLHVDAAQSIGKLPVHVEKWQADLVSFSAHKAYGPKGIGCLYVRAMPRVKIKPLFYGGGQERQLRPGTLATHQIVGMAKAFELASEKLNADQAHYQSLAGYFKQRLSAIDGIVWNGSPVVPSIINMSISSVDANLLWSGLSALAVSRGSACQSGSTLPSQVLLAMGHSQALAHASVRLSFGRYTTQAMLTEATDTLVDHIQAIRGLSPWNGLEK